MLSLKPESTEQLSQVLVVEDDKALQLLLHTALERSGYKVTLAGCTTTAIEVIHARPPDVVLLDLMLPDGDGLELVTTIKACHPSCVVIVVSALDAESKRVEAFQLGADDYVTKPFSVRELIERIRVRRSGKVIGNVVARLGHVTIDLSRHTIFRDDTRLSLTRQETRVLSVLLSLRGQTVTREHLLKEVWHFPSDARTRALDYVIKSLRRKLERQPTSPELLVTVRGVGYQLRVSEHFDR
jgi:DNA-binding response OmpR family regulator